MIDCPACGMVVDGLIAVDWNGTMLELAVVVVVADVYVLEG